MQSSASGSLRRKWKFSLLQSVGSRLFLSILGGSLVGLGLTSLLSYRELARQSEAELLSSLQVKAQNLGGEFETFQNSTHLIADTLVTLHASGEKREQVYVDLIRRALHTSPLATGLGFGQPPNNRLLIPDRQYAYPYAIRRPKDRAIVAKGGESDASFYQEEYFTQPIKAGRPVWLEPVSYRETTLDPPRDLVTTSYTLPVYNEKKQLLGVLSQDLELGFLSSELNRTVMRDAGNFVLVSAQGNLIAYPPDPKQAIALKPFRQLNNYEGLWNHIQQSFSRGEKSGIVQWRDANGAKSFWAFEQIPSNNWVLMAEVPQSVVLGPVVRFTALGTLGSVLGASLLQGVVVALFVRHLNRRLQPIMDECNRLAETNAKSEELMSREDELGRLTISFYALLGQVTVNERRLRKEMQRSEQALQALQQTQAQLIQTEKMSSLGQLVAGVAHEINNPINFIYGNLPHAVNYTQDLLHLVDLYDRRYGEADPDIQHFREEIDLEFLIEDLQKMLASMQIGTDRIREIVLSLRNFSRLDEAEMKRVNIHDGIDSTILILQNRLKPKPDHPGIEIVKQYGQLPLVECYAGQLNQVFMNILSNAVDALDKYNTRRSPDEIDAEPPTITITTQLLNGKVNGNTVIRFGDDNTKVPMVRISIRDNGAGISKEHLSKLFDPFFTTKPIGKGTGLGLSISYQIICEKHKGELRCVSEPGKGADFVIEIPVRHPDISKIT